MLARERMGGAARLLVDAGKYCGAGVPGRGATTPVVRGTLRMGFRRGAQGAAMKIGKWSKAMRSAAPFLAGCMVVGLTGCGDFWQAPSTGGSTSFALSNSGNLSVSPGATSGNTATISVTPSNSFTGTVTLSCAVTTSPSSAISPTTCSLDQTSVSITDTNAQTATLTAATTSTTTTGAYNITVTGVSGTVSETTTVCVEVSTSSGACGSTAGASGVFYVLNQTAESIAGYSIVSGTLTPVNGSPTALGILAYAIAVAPNGKFLYVSTLNGIYLYTINSDGSLTLGNGSQAVVGDPAYTMQVDATNQWLVEAVSGIGEVYAVNIDPSTGLPVTGTEQQQTISGTTITQLAISPDTSTANTAYYVFVGMGGSGTAVVRFNPNNTDPFGAANTIRLQNSSGGAEAVAVDPSNRLLYIGETAAVSGSNSGGLCVSTIGATQIAPISSSCYATGGIGPRAILPEVSGDYVYVASWIGTSNGNIEGYSITATGSGNSATYSLTSPTSVSAGDQPNGLAEDSSGSYILAVNFGSNPDFEAYTISSGALTSAISASTVSSGTAGAYAIASVP